MKLKKLAKIERFIDIMTGVLILPFGLLALIGKTLIWSPIEWLYDKKMSLMYKFGNYMLKQSDEVKNGTFKNKDMIKTFTCQQANAVWEAEQNKNKKFEEHDHD